MLGMRDEKGILALQTPNFIYICPMDTFVEGLHVSSSVMSPCD